MESKKRKSLELEIKISRNWQAYLELQINGKCIGNHLDAFQVQEILYEAMHNFYKYGRVEDELEK